MTVTENVTKILDKKNKQNEAHYNLSKKPAEISAPFSKDLVDKYEYLTEEKFLLKD